MKFAYEDMGEDQFEKLIVLLCQKLFGISVQGFTKGPDGGKDAKFTGTAELFPSSSSPWVGITIIQAKHTNGYNRSYSETDFFSESSKNTVLGKEIPRIARLRKAKELDNYILFSNRRLAGRAEQEIKQHISTNSDVPLASIYLCDVDQLDLWLKKFPSVVASANLDPVDSPLIVSPDELSDIVLALASQAPLIKNAIVQPPTPRVPFTVKNKHNNMAVDYAAQQQRLYLKQTAQIHAFLADPQNADILTAYQTVVSEFNLKIVSKRKDYQEFNEVLEYLVELLFGRDPILRSNKRLTRVILFYMYWNCDLGEVPNAESL